MYAFLKIGGRDPKDAGPWRVARVEISLWIPPLRAAKGAALRPDDDSREVKTRTAEARRQ
jgi:hypothetical protein